VFEQALSGARTLVAVADGMGGHAAGDVASALAIETLQAALEDGKSLEQAFTAANERVHAKSKEPGKHGMGTTMVAVVVDGDEYTVANVGDSRCYLLSADGIKQLSEDHSFVAEAMKRGQSEEEAQASKFRDALTRSIGIDDEVQVDTFGPFPVENDTALFLCSDGLYKIMKDARIRELFGQSGGPRGAAQSMVATAYEDGSDDNISVALAEFGEVKRDRAMGTIPIEFEPPPPAEPAGEADDDADGGHDPDGGGDTVADAKPADRRSFVRPADRRAFSLSKTRIRVIYVAVGVAVASALLYVLLVL
jgi:protein phosphatase